MVICFFSFIFPVEAQCDQSWKSERDSSKAKAKHTPDIVGVAKKAGNFKTLLAAADAAGLVPALTGKGPITVFAPTDATFAKLPEGTVATLLEAENRAMLARILKYHVVSGANTAKDLMELHEVNTLAGETVSLAIAEGHVGGAKILAADIHASNGVIHVIDAVLIPQAPQEATQHEDNAGGDVPEAKEAPSTIVDVAASTGKFKTLLAAAKAAGLVDTLKGEGPLTIFAPTDEAFAKLPEGTVASLLKEENRARLIQILTHHVVAGANTSLYLKKQKSLETLSGDPVQLSLDWATLRVGGALVLGADIRADNGIIHVIDSVLIPPVPSVFPHVTGESLEDTSFNLPGDFEAEVNLVLVAFKRHQQDDIDTWLHVAPALVEDFPQMNYYELPTLAKGWKIFRGMIDGGMKRGISDRSQRERTITLYISKSKFKKSLQIESEKSIYAFLINREGRVIWSVDGVHTPEKEQALRDRLTGISK
jgi:uncharacterized surface protein with fasciclin (FAS1) repeats